MNISASPAAPFAATPRPRGGAPDHTASRVLGKKAGRGAYAPAKHH